MSINSLIVAIGLMIVTSSAYSQNESEQAATGISNSPVARVSEKCVFKDVTLKASLLSAGVVGDSSMLSVVVENRSEEQIPYSYGKLPSAFYFTLIDLRTQKPVPLTRFGRRYLTNHIGGSMSTEKLGPSASLTYEFNLARYFDLSVAGEYKVLLDWPADILKPVHNSNLHIRNLKFALKTRAGQDRTRRFGKIPPEPKIAPEPKQLPTPNDERSVKSK